MDVVIVIPVMLSGKVAWICMINDALHREVDLSRLAEIESRMHQVRRCNHRSHAQTVAYPWRI